MSESNYTQIIKSIELMMKVAMPKDRKVKTINNDGVVTFRVVGRKGEAIWSSEFDCNTCRMAIKTYGKPLTASDHFVQQALLQARCNYVTELGLS